MWELIGYFGVALLFSVIIMPVITYLMASLNFCFTFVDEGEAKAVVRGGQFVKILFAREGSIMLKTTDDVTKWNTPSSTSPKTKVPKASLWEIVSENEATLKGIKATKKSFWRKWISGEIIGAQFYGIYPFFSIYSYDFEWTGVTNKGGSSAVNKKKDTLTHIFVKDVIYANLVQGAESEDMLPLDVSYRLTLRVVNPHEALFKVHRWLDAVLELTAPTVRSIIAEKSFADMKSMTDKEFAKALMVVKREMHERYGVDFIDAKLNSVSISPGKQAEQYEKASTALYVATNEAAKTKAEADGNAHKILVEGKATGEAYKAQTEGVINTLLPQLQNAAVAIIQAIKEDKGGNTP